MCVENTKILHFGELLIYHELIYYETMFPEVLNEQINCSNWIFSPFSKMVSLALLGYTLTPGVGRRKLTAQSRISYIRLCFVSYFKSPVAMKSTKWNEDIAKWSAWEVPPANESALRQALSNTLNNAAAWPICKIDFLTEWFLVPLVRDTLTILSETKF